MNVQQLGQHPSFQPVAHQQGNQDYPLRNRVCCNWQMTLFLLEIATIIMGIALTLYLSMPMLTMIVTGVGVLMVGIYALSMHQNAQIPTISEYEALQKANAKMKRQLQSGSTGADPAELKALESNIAQKQEAERKLDEAIATKQGRLDTLTENVSRLRSEQSELKKQLRAAKDK